MKTQFDHPDIQLGTAPDIEHDDIISLRRGSARASISCIDYSP